MARRGTRPIARLAIGALLALLANGLLSQTAAADNFPPLLGEGRVGVIVLQCLRTLSLLLGGP
jgi:hypothetical protein